jgi:hypothetical protein
VSIRRLCLAHLVANALLLWLGYEWLGVGEGTIPRLLWSAVFALAILTAFCGLHGATFSWFRGANIRVRLFPLVLAVITVIVLYALLAKWADYSPQPAFKLASYLTLKFRKPVKPATVLRVFNAALWLVRWVLLPLILLPVASGVSALGWRGFREFGWRGRGWLLAPILLLCGLWLPFVLLGWVPRVSGFWLQMASFVVRTGMAYLLFVAAAVALAFVTSRGRPVLSQPSTAPSP